MTWWNRLRYLLTRRRVEQDLEEELRAHLDLATDDAQETGLSPREARYTARRTLGNLTLIKEDTRAMWGWTSLERLAQDLRFTFRSLRKSPGFTAVAVLTLALGIGANTAIFSIVDGVLLRPPAYQDASQLVLVSRSDQSQTGHALSLALLHAIRERTSVLEQLAGFQYESFNLSQGGEPERLQGMVATDNLFLTLGIAPQLGRTFLPGEDQPGQPRIAVLSHSLWTRKFAADPGIIGRQIRLNSQSYRVIGVMPASFRFDRGEGLPKGFDFSPKTELWVPLQLPITDRGNYLLSIARIKSRFNLSQAQTQMKLIARRLEQEYSNAPRGLNLSLNRLNEEVIEKIRSPLLILSVAVSLLLLIACINVANLLLSRVAARKAEFSIRTVLGAGKWRLVQQWSIECITYTLLAGALGLILASWSVQSLLHLFPAGLLRADNIGLHWPVAIFCLFVSLATGLGLSLVPFSAILRSDLYTAVKRGRSSGGGREGQALRRYLIAAEIGLAVVLLASAGLLTRSFFSLMTIDRGFQVTNVITAQIDLPESKYPDGMQMVNFFRTVLSKLKDRPEIGAAGVVTILPLGGMDRDGPGFTIVGRPSGAESNIPASITMPLISQDYFQAMGIPLRQGRYFTEVDNENTTGAAIINEATARRWFPKGDAIGQDLSALNGKLRFTIVGVVHDVRHWGLDITPQPMIYVPFTQVPRATMALLIRPMTLVVRGKIDAKLLPELIRKAVRETDSEQPLSNLRTMNEVLERSLAERRMLLAMISVFAIAALLLAAIGVYGVISYSVAQRRNEIGIRMALGATRADVHRLIIHQGLRPVLIGLVGGLLGGLAVGRILKATLFGISPSDPLTFACAALLLLVVAASACYLPALRATKIDPMTALRYE